LPACLTILSTHPNLLVGLGKFTFAVREICYVDIILFFALSIAWIS
jgi:hypothetical protein